MVEMFFIHVGDSVDASTLIKEKSNIYLIENFTNPLLLHQVLNSPSIFYQFTVWLVDWHVVPQQVLRSISKQKSCQGVDHVH